MTPASGDDDDWSLAVAGKVRDPAREAWISTALRVLAEDGLEGVRVERLAKKLGVSKGPFYWRFADRAELLKAMLEHWKLERTGRLIETIASLPTARARLEELMRLALEETYGSIDVAKLEGALRAWAAQDQAASEVVREVDAERLHYLVTELKAMGAPAAEAGVLARAIYLALIGLYTARRYTPELANDDAYRRMVLLALDAAEGGTRARSQS